MSLAAYIPIIGPAIEKLLNLIPDPNERARGEAEFQKSLLAALTAEDADNREINKVEAAHRSIFVSGWRPFIGWVCGAALAFQYLIRPFWIWAAAIWWPGNPVPPTLDGMLWELVMGMLGIGGLRTIEKWKGIAR
jgi:hypothetical protein